MYNPSFVSEYSYSERTSLTNTHRPDLYICHDFSALQESLYPVAEQLHLGLELEDMENHGCLCISIAGVLVGTIIRILLMVVHKYHYALQPQ